MATVTATDFKHLYDTSMAWACNGWESREDRFEESGLANPINFKFKRAYWFSDYTALVLAKSFLARFDHPYQALTDEGFTDTPYLIITDYEAK